MSAGCLQSTGCEKNFLFSSQARAKQRAERDASTWSSVKPFRALRTSTAEGPQQHFRFPHKVL